MKKLAARDFEDLLQVWAVWLFVIFNLMYLTLQLWYQCSIPAFEDLLPQKHDKIIRKLLFELATWHALAKLRLHTESTLNALENSATRLGSLLRKFKTDVCSAYATRNLPSEEAARGRCQAAKAQKAGGGAQPPTKTSAKVSKFRNFNMETYKLHGEKMATGL